MIQISKNLSKKGAAFIKKWHFLYVIIGFLIWGLFGIFLQSSITDSNILKILSTIFFITWVGFIIIGTMIYNKSINYILLEQLDIDDYRRHLNKQLIFRKRQETYRIINLAQVDFLEGHFKESNSKLSQVELQLLRNQSDLHYKLLYYRYKFLNDLMLNQPVNIEEFIKNINQLPLKNNSFKVRIQEEGVALYDIFSKKESNQYFASHFAQNRLQSLLYQYYQAINLHNAGCIVESQALFKQVSKENNYLFIVKESKKYLKVGFNG